MLFSFRIIGGGIYDISSTTNEYHKLSYQQSQPEDEATNLLLFVFSETESEEEVDDDDNDDEHDSDAELIHHTFIFPKSVYYADNITISDYQAPFSEAISPDICL